MGCYSTVCTMVHPPTSQFTKPHTIGNGVWVCIKQCFLILTVNQTLTIHCTASGKKARGLSVFVCIWRPSQSKIFPMSLGTIYNSVIWKICVCIHTFCSSSSGVHFQNRVMGEIAVWQRIWKKGCCGNVEVSVVMSGINFECSGYVDIFYFLMLVTVNCFLPESLFKTLLDKTLSCWPDRWEQLGLRVLLKNMSRGARDQNTNQ